LTNVPSKLPNRDWPAVQEQSNPTPSPAWLLKAGADAQTIQALAAHLGCPLAIAQVLVTRGVDTQAAAKAFLNPTIEALLDDPATDPAKLLGMNAAVERILAAIRAGEPILIYGDYDVDGTTATVLLKTTIERIALAIDPAHPTQVTYHLPHRIREGYGMQNAILGEAAKAGVRLVISVDTGIRAIVEAVEARALGLDLIVTDHHLPDDAAIPDALVVVNPAQPGCPYPNKNLCGAAVAFKLAQALLAAAAPLTADAAAFRARTRGVLVPSFLKLVAIATVADSVSLTGENRTIAALGLAALANPVQPGLRALMQLASIPLDRAPTATEVGFRLAPRINAAGRMDIADDVVELLLTRDSVRARELAVKLDGLNQDRRASEARALDAIDRELQPLLDADGAYPPECLILDHPEWHRGVLGILASRVVERTGRPALIVTHADGDAHGSGRSVPGFHLLDALTAADAEDPATPLFHRFGGHAHAVGFSLPSDRLPLLRARMRSYASSRLTPALLLPQLDYDAELSLAEITPELMAWIARCAPFGIGNPEPIFLTRNVTLAAPIRLIQERHISLQLMQRGPQQQEGVKQQSAPREQSNPPAIPALGWSRDPLGWPARCARLALAKGSVIDVLYRLRHNTGPYASPQFGGLELELCDLRPASATLRL
jgi:single-stranded-DNA-specific exonuclease